LHPVIVGIYSIRLYFFLWKVSVFKTPSLQGKKDYRRLFLNDNIFKFRGLLWKVK
jgi:hypothetical protein